MGGEGNGSLKWVVENGVLGYNDIVEFVLKLLMAIFLLETSYFFTNHKLLAAIFLFIETKYATLLNSGRVALKLLG